MSQAGSQADWKEGREAGRQAGRKLGKPTGRQVDKTEKQAGRIIVINSQAKSDTAAKGSNTFKEQIQRSSQLCPLCAGG